MLKCENKFLIIIKKKLFILLFNSYLNFKFFKYLIKINEIFYQIK